jgi:hypothetical protein
MLKKIKKKYYRVGTIKKILMQIDNLTSNTQRRF